MPWRPHGRASVNPSAPRAFGICDRCEILYNLNQLMFQYDYRGAQLVNIRIRVCKICYDVPYQGNTPLRLPPDPTPVLNPRPVGYARDAAVNENPPPMWDEPGLLYDDGRTDWQL